AGLRAAHLTAREKFLAAKEEALRIRAARIDGMRAELAAEMTDGSPCPVGGASFPPVSRDEEDAAAARADAAAQAANDAAQDLARADALLGDLAQRLAADGFALAALVRAGDAGVTAAALTDAVQAAAAAAGEREAEAARLDAAAARLTRLQGELDELDAAIAADKAALVELTSHRDQALAAAAAADARAATQRAELAAKLGGA